MQNPNIDNLGLQILGDKLWEIIKQGSPLRRITMANKHDWDVVMEQNMDVKIQPNIHGAVPEVKIGAKHDQGKLLWGCMTQGLAPVLKGVVAVLTYGAQKYSRDSWQDVPNAKQRYMDAFERHISDYHLNKRADEESGLHPLFHAICDLMFVTWFEMQEYQEMDYPKDDWYKFNKVEKKNG